MLGFGNGGGRRAPFTGGLWGSNPFRRSGRGGTTSQPPPQHANLPTLGEYGYVGEDHPEGQPSYGAMRPGMGAYDGGNTPMGPNISHTSYQESDGNVHGYRYRPGGPYSSPMHAFQMYLASSGECPPVGGRFSAYLAGDVPGPFMSVFPTGANSVRGLNGREGPIGFSGQERGLQPDGAFAFELQPAPLPRDNGLSEENAMVIADFIQQHTQPIGEGGTNAPPNSECPICLEPPSLSHLCVQIKGISGCNHMIGRDCLKELLTHDSDEKKECPLCRAEFLASNYIEQGSDEWNSLAQGRGGPARGSSRMPAGYGGDPFGYAAPRGPPRGSPGGMSNIRGLDDVGMDGQGGGPPIARGQGNFIGSGQRLGGPQSGYYQQQVAPNYGGGMEHYGGAGRL
ncbi:zf-RING-2 multi-domain protein [Pyrenophora tritici-repentis]|uniref:Ring finger domain containing protein n=2 Tax=Pyrenophora tritici-repentis TaxID=45151 RepID=A0A2W1FTJ1_9PLEO|nr:uncharacterized protein PTRG_09436 [Pyrenophora tritici-repentis Pt-1C-BFP]KAA8617704.1 zf-RING-2 multi-domain protein [Pyrenophora tritici-repentis]EDU42487.1 predicted protein [Pyrenophora tritici-repentis Pt-1C-BFP]KAF7442031.1 zf-RING-2 multi-domain protein [Pyrenophora tritici-repentis]KAF7568046.1 zf-RING-2 multi-domain protein [Pyrenophora tritici-repentis]KAI0573153.1 zf-RING-2 multi-domain protein [Pyrenophora tritici-repentis]